MINIILPHQEIKINRNDGLTYKVVCNYYKAGNIINSAKYSENVLPQQDSHLILYLNYFYIILILLLYLK